MQDDVDAMVSLAECYHRGSGVAQNDASAKSWLLLAATHGLAVAQFRLGTFYADGTGVAQDDVMAAAWLGKAAEQGYKGAAERRDACLEALALADAAGARAGSKP
jgi:TPR repeat protein